MSRRRKPSPTTIRIEALTIPDPPTPYNQQSRSNQRYDWVRFGEDNLYPRHLVDVARQSPTLKSIIGSKSKYLVGNLVTDYVPNMEYGLGELLGRLSRDYFYGNCYFQIVERGGVRNIYHIDATKCRKGKDGGVYVSANWSKSNYKEYHPLFFPTYPNTTMMDGNKVSMVHVKDYEEGFDYYGLPDWVGSLSFARVEYLIGLFNNNAFDNSLFSSGILKVPAGGRSEEEIAREVKKITSSLIGTENANNGKLVVIMSDDPSSEATWTPISATYEGSFLDLKALCEQTLISSSNWFPSISGIKTAGQLGNNQQVVNEHEMAIKSIEEPRSKLLKALEPFLDGDIEFDDSLPISNKYDSGKASTVMSIFKAYNLGEITEDQKDFLIDNI